MQRPTSDRARPRDDETACRRSAIKRVCGLPDNHRGALSSVATRFCDSRRGLCGAALILCLCVLAPAPALAWNVSRTGSVVSIVRESSDASGTVYTYGMNPDNLLGPEDWEGGTWDDVSAHWVTFQPLFFDSNDMLIELNVNYEYAYLVKCPGGDSFLLERQPVSRVILSAPNGNPVALWSNDPELGDYYLPVVAFNAGDTDAQNDYRADYSSGFGGSSEGTATVALDVSEGTEFGDFLILLTGAAGVGVCAMGFVLARGVRS